MGSAEAGCLCGFVSLCVAWSTGSRLMERPVLSTELRAPHTPATVGGNMVAHEGDGVSRADEPAEEHAQHGGESRPPMAVEPRAGDAEAAQIDPVERVMRMLLEQQATAEKQRVAKSSQVKCIDISQRSVTLVIANPHRFVCEELHTLPKALDQCYLGRRHHGSVW